MNEIEFASFVDSVDDVIRRADEAVGPLDFHAYYVDSDTVTVREAELATEELCRRWPDVHVEIYRVPGQSPSTMTYGRGRTWRTDLRVAGTRFSLGKGPT